METTLHGQKAVTSDNLSDLRLLRPAQKRRVPPPRRARVGRAPLGQILVDLGYLSPGDLLKAVSLRGREDARLGDILIAHGWITETQLMHALAQQWGASPIDLTRDSPDPRLIDALGAEFCCTKVIAPIRRVGGVTLLACAHPDLFASIQKDLPKEYGPYRMAIATERAITDSLLARRKTQMIRRAESRVASVMSCRERDERRAATWLFGVLFAGALGLTLMPLAVFALLSGWAILTLVLTSALKLWAGITQARSARYMPQTTPAPAARLPVISIMVPMFREPDIAARLVARMSRLHYPRELLDMLLVVEEDDHVTRDALAKADLPRWMRVLPVPDGPIRTKPRALNYALNFCRGSIIGVYDAEDAPHPDQLHMIARRFAKAPPEVVCLQGILDYYNPRTNWLSRCFTIEYATWFRMVLPGIAKLGFVVPLGGTTLFFRRKVLEELGCWDAHNVTEDADLGVRLARKGYRTELVPTVTQEEANCRMVPWVKQRSRWLKGYAITWAVHMRSPRKLMEDLGPRRFWAFQVMFFGSLSQYVLAPLLWSFWLMVFGLPHPVQSLLSDTQITLLVAVFVTAELLNICLAAWAVRGESHRFLIPWVPSMHLYFPLGAIAGWKAIYELVQKPFYWDKTTHGIFDLHITLPASQTEQVPIAAPPRPQRAPWIS
ncbi:glycosyltransferase family 2 protein [Thioclava litoralis]|uniref:Glycosyltransferase family 2 protein n=1 Tax=Thioclava litoralis TaxID=3076557 RepID=A0ABZ1DWE8_9RHOB|nr:glycosyltransferase family 2 protein [Thioclava sp. FTW29]